MKEEGNALVKSKQYKNAIVKYNCVWLFLKDTIEGKKSTLTSAQKKEAKELQSTTFLNIAICHHFENDFSKAADCALKAINLKTSIKGYYRLGLALKMLK